MKKYLVPIAIAAAWMPSLAKAGSFTFDFEGPGVSGMIDLTYGSATDSTYSNAFEVTGISGTITDTNNGLNLMNANIDSLVALNFASPEPTNLLAPHDFSKFAVATGLPVDNNGFLSYDNLYWPGGSPPTATDYPFGGGFLDIYGLMFTVDGGDLVNFWSNADTGSGVSYGMAVATADQALDYVGGVNITPEPGTFALLGGGLLGLIGFKRYGRRNQVRG